MMSKSLYLGRLQHPGGEPDISLGPQPPEPLEVPQDLADPRPVVEEPGSQSCALHVVREACGGRNAVRRSTAGNGDGATGSGGSIGMHNGGSTQR